MIDRVLERDERRLVATTRIDPAADYLRDHFPTFPVLPGVLMLEAMVQAAREHADPGDQSSPPLVLGAVRALKYGRFVDAGATIRIEVTLAGEGPDYRGRVEILENEGADASDGVVAASGRFTLRPARVARPGGAKLGAHRAYA